MRNNLPGRTSLRIRCTVAAALSAVCPATAQAQAETVVRGFHLGVTLPAARLGATMQKTVDNTAPNTLVPAPRRGQEFHDEASGQGFSYGIGVVGGYRLPLSGGSWFLEGDAGIEWHGGATEAQFAGVGTSADRRQLGESWPDRWTFAKDMSYGATLRLGAAPGGTGSGGLAIYLLAGVNFTGVQYTNHYTGCFSPEPCAPSGYGSGTEELDLDFTAWKAGIGVERPLGEKVVIRAEAGYTVYSREEWVTPFDDVVVTVLSGMDANEVGLSLGLARYF